MLNTYVVTLTSEDGPSNIFGVYATAELAKQDVLNHLTEAYQNEPEYSIEDKELYIAVHAKGIDCDVECYYIEYYPMVTSL